MNDKRKEEIAEITRGIVLLRYRIETVREEGYLYFDDLVENLASSEKLEKAENVISELDNAVSSCSEIERFLKEASV